MNSIKKLQVGIFLSIIGLGLLFYHIVQYLLLIERINLLFILFGGGGIDSSFIILEIFLGFGAIILGIIYLGSMYSDIKKERSLKPLIIQAQQLNYCQNCGQKITIPNTKFCVNCGDNLNI